MKSTKKTTARISLGATHVSPGVTAPRKGQGTSILTHAKVGNRPIRDVDTGAYARFPDGSLRKIPMQVQVAKPAKKVRKKAATKSAKPLDITERAARGSGKSAQRLEEVQNTAPAKKAPAKRSVVGKLVDAVAKKVGGKKV